MSRALVEGHHQGQSGAKAVELPTTSRLKRQPVLEMLASSLFLASGSAFLAARPSAHSILPGRLSASPTMGLSDGLEPSLRAGMSAASSKMAFGPPGRVLGGAASAWVLLFNADQPDEVSSKLLSSLPHAAAQLLAVTATLLRASIRCRAGRSATAAAPTW